MMTHPSDGQPAGQAGITVHGTGEVRAAPDIVLITLGVEVHADRVSDARERAAGAHRAVLDAVRALGVAAEDIQTSRLSIQPRYDHQADGPPRIAGYTMSNRVQLTVRDIETAGPVLDAAIDAGGDTIRVDSFHFGLSDPAPLVAEARRAAILDAQTAARQLAEAAGARPGEVISIVEMSGSAAPVAKGAMLRMAAADTPVEPGESAVTVHVLVRFALEQA